MDGVSTLKCVHKKNISYISYAFIRVLKIIIHTLFCCEMRGPKLGESPLTNLPLAIKEKNTTKS